MRTKSVILTGMFAAVLAVLSQISIPLPSGVPVTLQTFAVALTAYVLGTKRGLAATGIYILLGMVGIPVFAGFSAGVGIVLGMSGGFIWGFFPLVLLCGLSLKQKNRWVVATMGGLGLVICHLLGIVQFMAVMNMRFVESAMLCSVPYLIKDIGLQFAAYFAAGVIRKALKAAGVMEYV